jgi:hypothetical protein
LARTMTRLSPTSKGSSKLIFYSWRRKVATSC